VLLVGKLALRGLTGTCGTGGVEGIGGLGGMAVALLPCPTAIKVPMIEIMLVKTVLRISNKTASFSGLTNHGLSDKDKAIQHTKNRANQTDVEADLSEKLSQRVPVFRSSS
jgi:hypothetical protein